MLIMIRLFAIVAPILVAVLVATNVAPSAWAQAPPPHHDGLLVVAVGASVDAELIDDLTEGLHFATKRAAAKRDFRFLPKEKVKSALGYLGPKSPGSCILDRECLRKAHKTLGTRFFLLVRLQPSDGRFQIVVTRIGEKAADDVVKDGSSPTGAANFMNAARSLILSSLEDPRITLSLSVNEKGAAIEVGGKVLTGTTIRVRPGRYRIRVTKEGFVPFEASVDCVAGQPCVVPANIFRSPTIPTRPTDPRPTDPTADPVPRILQITGWSAAGLGVALTITGIVFGAQSSSALSELEDACASGVCTLSRGDAEDKRSKGEDGATLFNALGIPGMILTAGGLATAIVGHVLAARSPGSKGDVEVTPAIGPGGTTLLMTRIRF